MHWCIIHDTVEFLHLRILIQLIVNDSALDTGFLRWGRLRDSSTFIFFDFKLGSFISIFAAPMMETTPKIVCVGEGGTARVDGIVTTAEVPLANPAVNGLMPISKPDLFAKKQLLI